MPIPSYKRHRFPSEIIAYAVWLFYRFALSFRDVEELLASKGVNSAMKQFACGAASSVLSLSESCDRIEDDWDGAGPSTGCFIRINGTIHYLWRAVDHNGVVVDILVQAKRDRAAAERFFRYLVHSAGTLPHTVVTDRLRSYSATLPRVLPKVRHQRGHWLNNRAENSHQPTRERERRTRRFKSPEQAQQFLSVHSAIASHFRPRRHRLTAARYRAIRRQQFRLWNITTHSTAFAIPA